MFLVENIQGYAFAVVEKNYAVQLGVSIYQFDMNVFFFNYFVQQWIFVVPSIYELWLPSKL